MNYSVGLDPGAKGGIAIIGIDKNISVFKTPTVSEEIDPFAIAKLIKSLDGDKHVVIEDVHSIFGTSAKSNFQFGRSLGILQGIVAALGIPFTMVAPKEWQKTMWQGIRPVEIPTDKKNKDGSIKYKIDTKATSLLAATRLFPNVNLLPTERSKKPHDGIVDALLMAEYCRRKFQ